MSGTIMGPVVTMLATPLQITAVSPQQVPAVEATAAAVVSCATESPFTPEGFPGGNAAAYQAIVGSGTRQMKSASPVKRSRLGQLGFANTLVASLFMMLGGCASEVISLSRSDTTGKASLTYFDDGTLRMKNESPCTSGPLPSKKELADGFNESGMSSEGCSIDSYTVEKCAGGRRAKIALRCRVPKWARDVTLAALRMAKKKMKNERPSSPTQSEAPSPQTKSEVPSSRTKREAPSSTTQDGVIEGECDGEAHSFELQDLINQAKGICGQGFQPRFFKKKCAGGTRWVVTRCGK